ncbi:MAG TPA: hypothetical protein VH593_04300 [Ktedonobacteraceae bacterium]
MRNRRRYPKNWPELARACKDRAGWHCEKCNVAHGTERLSVWTGNTYCVYMQAAHVDHDFENPAPRLACVCPTCHWHYFRKPAQLPRWFIERLRHRQLLKRRGQRLKPLRRPQLVTA